MPYNKIMRPVVLIVLDGWGYNQEERGNAIALADTPTIDLLDREFPTGLLQASGISVGLPWNEPGNSEVGHMALGTGKILYQPMVRIGRNIESGAFFQNPALKKASQHVKKYSSAFHIAGLLGSGSVHSYLDHIWALVEFAEKEGLKNVFLHLFLDGKDSPPKEGVSLLENIVKGLSKEGSVGKVSTVVGRHWAMDRSLRWERTVKTWELLTKGKGEKSKDVVASVKAQYEKGINDDYIEPIVAVDDGGNPLGLIKEDDSVVFFNFREDRMRQLASAFVRPEKVAGANLPFIPNLRTVTMTEYERGFPTLVAFPPPRIRNTLPELAADYGKTQFRIAETEKYAHVTYFFNGGKEQILKGETRKIVPSLKLGSVIEAPQMKAVEIGDELIAAIKSLQYDFLLANFANADMLGHTGNLEAAIKGVEAVDGILNDVIKAIIEVGGDLVITADHGNAEYMLDPVTTEVIKSHSSNPVPFYIVSPKIKTKASPKGMPLEKETVGILPDVTATLLDFMGIPVPPELNGESLLPGFIY